MQRETQPSMLDDAEPVADEPITGLAETLRRRRGHNFYPPKDIRSKVPALYSTENTPTADKTVWLHYFGPSQDWWITEANFDGADAGLAFGYCDLGFGGGEWGDVYLPELEAVNVKPHGSPVDIVIERDCYWTPVKFSGLNR